MSAMPHTSTTMAKKAKGVKGKLRKGAKRGDGSENVDYQCRECDEVFVSSLEVRVHRQQVHTGPSTWHPQFQCQSCEQTFAQKRGLHMHRMLQHGAPRRHQCDQCDYEGPRLYHLKRHMKVHTGERNHVCEVCNKGLKSLQAYRNHMVLHTNKGRYRCNECHKAFNQRTLYEDHCRTHREARCFSCKYCGAAFKTYKNVACHVRAVHLGDKRFICDVCGAQHMTGANLRAHQKIHQRIASLPRAYHCDQCNASFRGLRGLTVHLEVLHGVTEEGLEEVGRCATSQHPTRRPQHIDYAVVGDGERGETEEKANETLMQRKAATKMNDAHKDVEEEEIEEMENDDLLEEEINEVNEAEIIEVVVGEEETEGLEVSGLEEEEDGRTVLVESENYVFRVRPEEIEFEL